MKRHLSLLLGLAALGMTPLLAQPDRQHNRPQAQTRPQSNRPQAGADRNRPRANQGHIPPAPQARPQRTAPAEAERYSGGRINSAPHVNHDRWYGHDQPGDTRFHVAQPYAHGRFTRIGPSFRYQVDRFDAGSHRFWLPGGFYFQVAEADWPLSADWCWDCAADDFTIYDDPDHPGWYLVYNIHTGQYVHAEYYGT
jgi:hypothetical protein